jgi:hypothetical protein
MAHTLDGVVGQLAVWRRYSFDVAGFEGPPQGITQSFYVGRLHVQGFFALLEPEMRGGKAALAGDVDEGTPFGIGEVRAHLVPRRRYPVTHDPIVPEGCPSSMPTGGQPGSSGTPARRYDRSSSSARRIHPTTLQG